MGCEKQKISSDWWSKTFAGTVLGLCLSFGIVGLFAWISTDGLTQAISNERLLWKTQFNMWLVTPVWLLILSFVYLFRTGKQAVAWLTVSNLVIYLLLIFVKA
ncbi:hypothetical protein ACSLBF_12460 [Pseudoalteromonas sp. T1lg65]|uniref:hypothetical protein n=1 Tax=Pseudoalteromonas sp. T1lg65 TaxID=2077101 RepID=UPI003F7A7EE1